jgi:hypothetical protein
LSTIKSELQGSYFKNFSNFVPKCEISLLIEFVPTINGFVPELRASLKTHC